MVVNLVSDGAVLMEKCRVINNVAMGRNRGRSGARAHEAGDTERAYIYDLHCRARLGQ